MRSGLLHRARLAVPAVLLLLPTFPAAAQITLEVRQFSGDFEKWVTLLPLSAPQTLAFRWTRSESRGIPTKYRPGSVSAHWQLSVASTPPTGTDLPLSAIAASAKLPAVAVPGMYERFDIAKTTIPASAQSKFHVRVLVIAGAVKTASP